jgi:rhamnosyltransferase
VKVDVIIPVYKPGKKFSRLLKMLEKQTYPVGKIIIMNTEKAYWNDSGYEGIRGLEVHHLTKAEFDHGATRNRGARFSRADIIVFMTDDAVPADEYLIENLVKAFSLKGPDGQSVIMAYARQLPDKDCAMAERYTRSFNYPAQSRVKTKADLKTLGIKTFFASNVCCAYSREKFWFQGGFINKTIFNEDMIFAGKALLQDDYAIAYAAEARVIHSHNYGCAEQFRRNFDLAVSQADHPEIFGGISSESEGIRLVKSTAAYLCREHRPWLVPGMIVKSGFKYMGYRLGKCYRLMPKSLRRKCSMNANYWK